MRKTKAVWPNLINNTGPGEPVYRPAFITARPAFETCTSSSD
jgi:hypothetical protein